MTAHELRLSRYRPGVRQTATSTWTSVSDVGKTFDDGVLTQAEYERVEALYLTALERLIREGGDPDFVVSEVHVTPAASLAAREVRDGANVRGEELLELCRLELREELSCRLDSGDRAYVYVGFDFYVYVGCERLSGLAVAAIERSGLFIEHGVPSPYATSPEL